MRWASLWPTSLLFGALSISAPLACGGGEDPARAPAASSSGQAEAGVVDVEDIDLAVYPLRQHTGFDGAHDFQVPFSVFRAEDDLTVEASDASAVEIVPAVYAGAKQDGRYFLIKAKKAGTITLTARSRGKSVTSTLNITEYAATRYAAGEARYRNPGENQERACASCHEKSDGADHSPAAISSASDDAVKAVIRTGIDLSSSPIREVDHRWSVQGASLDGLVTYLRALPPRGYTVASQSLRSLPEPEWSPRWRPNGLARHVRANAPWRTSGNLVDSTRKLLGGHRDWIGTVDPERGLSLRRERTDALGMRRLRFAQRERGLPVLDAELSAHFDGTGALRSLDSTLVSNLSDIDLAPRIDPAAAERVVLEAFTRRFAGDPSRARLGFAAWGEPGTAPVLGIHTRGGARRLVYAIGLAAELAGQPVRLRARVDAHTGALLELYDDAKTVRGTSNGVFGVERNIEVEPTAEGYRLIDATRGGGIVTYTAAEEQVLPGTVLTSASKDGSWDQAAPNGKGSAVDAHFFAALVYDYYSRTFERRGIDGKSGTIHSTVHYGVKYDNAFWEGRQMAYGDGDLFGPFAGALDVVAHELTHGLTQSESDLEYVFQSGAINEAISDVFAAVIENQLSNDATKNWNIGENIQRTEGLPLRSMNDPGDSEVPQPYHMEAYLDLTLDQDNGGVHLNSGIVNHAAYLMTVGGTHQLSNVTVPGGIGWQKTAQLWYRVNTEYLLRQSEFVDCAQATLDAADDLGFSAEERDTVECAWKAVGVLAGACGEASPAPVEETLGDAGERASSSSGSGSKTAGRNDGAAGADFDKQAPACQATFAAASAWWSLGVLGLLGLRRRRAPSRALHPSRAREDAREESP